MVERPDIGGFWPQKGTRIHEKSEQQFSHEVFFHVEYRRSEIDQQARFDATRPEISEELGDMLGQHVPYGLQFNYELVLNEQIRKKLTRQRAILIVYTQGMLLEHFGAPFS
jgi:hypothetical protein